MLPLPGHQDVPGSSRSARLAIMGPSPGLGARVSHRRWTGRMLAERASKAATSLRCTRRGSIIRCIFEFWRVVICRRSVARQVRWGRIIGVEEARPGKFCSRRRGVLSRRSPTWRSLELSPSVGVIRRPVFGSRDANYKPKIHVTACNVFPFQSQQPRFPVSLPCILMDSSPACIFSDCERTSWTTSEAPPPA